MTAFAAKPDLSNATPKAIPPETNHKTSHDIFFKSSLVMILNIEKTATEIANEAGLKNKDWAICYQSRVGPLEWIGPSLDEELKRASYDNVGVIILPIAFVSEHSETLVELDIEYKKIAMDLKIPTYQRVPAVGTNRNFITSLVHLVRNSVAQDTTKSSNTGLRICPLNRSCHSYD